ncbi:hypothetical protein SVAN01_07545 [Stagonosporopsis vannaccii]|nr:hypothetical protein SVAN01_07545 [Stagonosporopsis vannaccii]
MFRRQPSSDCRPYEYEPLVFGSFRLVVLQAGPVGSPLIATIKHAPLVTPPAAPRPQTPYYEALSYTWGTSFVEDHLYITPNHFLDIGSNLNAALRRLRHNDRPRTLWVDALCINQNNAIERSQQVALMKEVYSGADKVLIFIGLEGHRSNEAMACIADVDSKVPAHELQAEAVHNLLQRPWFSRVWVVQEVARSRSAVVVCGSSAVPWECFCRWPYRRTHQELPFKSGGTEDLPGVLNYSSGHPPLSGSEGLLQLLHANRGAGATDLRDKIFGILGLMDDASPYLKLIDYTSTVESVYTSVACQIIQDSRSLKILSAAGRGNLDVFNQPASGRKVPSWVPDWSTVRLATSLSLGKTYVEPFGAGGRQSCIRLQYHNYEAKLLSALGTPVGPVKTVGEVARFGYVPSSLAQEKAEIGVLQRWYNIALRANIADEEYLATISATPQNAISATEDRMHSPQMPPASSDPKSTWHQWYQNPRSRRVSSVMRYRRLFICGKDFLGLGPENMQEGDHVVVLLGSPVPHVLRPVPNRLFDERFELVGECYVYGVMHGEAFHHVREEVEKAWGVLPPTSGGPCSGPLRWFDIA